MWVRWSTRWGLTRALVCDLGELAGEPVLGTGEVEPEVAERGGRGVFGVVAETEEQVLGADVVVAQAQCLLDGALEDVLRLLGEKPPIAALRIGSRRRSGAQAAFARFVGDARISKDLRRDRLGWLEQRKQQVVGCGVCAFVEACVLCGGAQDSLGAGGKALEGRRVGLEGSDCEGEALVSGLLGDAECGADLRP